MSLTWQTALPINHKSALLAMCDWANDDGSSVHPSIYAVAERLTCSERTAQRLLKDLIEDRWLAVVGNLNGGAPGATRQYRVNVRKLREVATAEEARRDVVRAARRANVKRKDEQPDPFETGDKLSGVETGDNLSRVTNPVETGDKPSMGGVTNPVETGDTLVTLPTIDPPVEPPVEPLPLAAPPAPPPPPKPVDPVDTELQSACRATWKAYADAYTVRYSIGPVRNTQVNAKVKQFVQRVGHNEAPSIAAFFVDSIEDALVLRQCHAVGLLLQGAEAYRMKWATGRKGTAAAMTANRQTETAHMRQEREVAQGLAPNVARVKLVPTFDFVEMEKSNVALINRN
jgi:hypothetical protein